MLTSDSGDALLDPLPALPCKMEKPTSVPIEIEPGKTLNIKPSCLHYRKNGGFMEVPQGERKEGTTRIGWIVGTALFTEPSFSICNRRYSG